MARQTNRQSDQERIRNQQQSRNRRLSGRRTRNSRFRRVAARRINTSKRKSAGASAKSGLRQFRQASILAVSVTALLLIILFPSEYTTTVEETDDRSTSIQVQNKAQVNVASVALLQIEGEELTEATDEVWQSAQNLWQGFYSNIPRFVAVIVIMLIAWLLSKLFGIMLRRITRSWQKSNAIVTISKICIWLLALGIALSVVAGDLRALVGSLGLVGLALSWALQTPIESFTGWLLNSFQGYYRVGDRIAVGDIYGDVYKIDFLTTTIWEMGGPYKTGFVNAEQPTGRLVTFANNEILSGSIVNFTRDFPYVWDEYAVLVANESDLAFAMQLMKKISLELLGTMMVEPAKQYEVLLRDAHLEFTIAGEPEIYLSAQDSWTNVVIRYLVPARERRKWKSELIFMITTELQKPEVSKKIITVYQRQQVQFINDEGRPVNSTFYGDSSGLEGVG